MKNVDPATIMSFNGRSSTQVDNPNKQLLVDLSVNPATQLLTFNPGQKASGKLESTFYIEFDSNFFMYETQIFSERIPYFSNPTQRMSFQLQRLKSAFSFFIFSTFRKKSSRVRTRTVGKRYFHSQKQQQPFLSLLFFLCNPCVPLPIVLS